MRAAVLPALLTVTLTGGCALFFPQHQQQQQAGAGYSPAGAQANPRAQLEQLAEKARAGGPNEKMQWAAYLSGVLSNEQAKASFGDEVDWAALQSEAETMMDEVMGSPEAQATPQLALNAAGTKAQLLLVTGRGAEAVALFQGLHDEAPTYDTATAVLRISVQASAPLENPVAFCGDNRAVVTTDEELYGYMNACMQANPSASGLSDGLPWAKKKDFETYARVDAAVIAEQQRRAAEEEARQAEEERRRAEEERRRQAQMAASSNAGGNGGGGSSAPSGPVTVSVTLRNRCRETVKLFYGDKPKFGSGTYSSLGGNSSTSKSFSEGDMVWIVDDGQNGLSSTTIGRGTNTVEITESCTGMTVR